jgi:hypothetical protein
VALQASAALADGEQREHDRGSCSAEQRDLEGAHRGTVAGFGVMQT